MAANQTRPAVPGSARDVTTARRVNDKTARCLPDPRRVENSAGIPELVQPARDAELGTGADVALIDLAVVADVLDDAHRPVLGQVDVLAVLALGADEAHHVRFLRFERLIHIL